MEESKEPLAAKCSGNGSVVEDKKKIKILVAVDDSEESMYALSCALQGLLTAAAGAPEKTEALGRLILVHATQPFHFITQPVGSAGYVTLTSNELRQSHEAISRKLLKKAKQVCRAKLVEAETISVFGDPKEMICQVAEQMQVDLLVVGSRGLSRIRRALFGSVSDYCAHNAKCPVLIVKSPKGN